MDFARAFSFPFSDQDWPKKILIPALIALIPIIGTIYISGWMIEIVRRVLRGDLTPLPEEIDFGGYFMDGLKIFVIGLIYSIPLIIFYAPWIATIIAGSGGAEDSTVGVLSLISTCCCGLGFLYLLFVGFLMPAVYGVYANDSTVGAGFRFNEIFSLIKAAPGAYVMVVLGWIVVGLIVSIASVVPYIGTIIAGTYGQAAISHLSAQAYQQARGSGAAFGGGARVYPA
jgi:hypothetical protein